MAASIRELQDRFGHRYKWWVMMTVMIGTITTSLSSTIVNVALPDIMADFDIGHTAVQWLVTAFLASMAIGMLINAWMVDRFGPRATYLWAIVIFIVAALVGGYASSFAMLISVRVVQGLIAGLVQPLAMVMLYSVFPPKHRGQAIGLYAMGVVLGPSAGPVVGGVLVDWMSWRAVFFVVLPFGLLTIWLARRYLASPETGGVGRRRFDLIGILLLSGWVTALLWALSEGPTAGWSSLPVVAGAVAAALMFTAFTLRQLRSRSPLLALGVFRYPGFTATFLVALLTGAGLFGSVYLLPLLVQKVMGESASTAGLILMPAGVAMGLAFPLIGRLTDTLRPALLVAVGLVIFSASVLVLSDAGIGTSFALIATMAALSRIGLAMMMPPVVIGAMIIVPPELVNQATGLVSFARQFGGSIGVSLAAILLQEGTLWSAALGLPAGAPGYQDAFLLYGVVFLVGLIAVYKMRAIRQDNRHGE